MSYLENLIFKTKQLNVLLLLKDKTHDWHISDLAKQANVTYVHACNFIKACESLGITKGEKHGKIKVVRLTDRGTQIVENISNARTLMNKEPPQVQQQQPAEPVPKS